MLILTNSRLQICRNGNDNISDDFCGNFWENLSKTYYRFADATIAAKGFCMSQENIYNHYRTLMLSMNAMGDPELTVYTNETTHPSKYIKMEFYPDSTFVEGLQDDSLTVTSLGDNGTAFYKDDFRYAMGNTTVPVIACIKRLGYYILAVKSGDYIWENGCNVLYLQDQKFFGGNITYKSDVIKIGNNVDTNQEVGDVQIKNDATLLFDSNKRTIIQNGFKCAKGAKLVLK